MHIKKITRGIPRTAGIRNTLELSLLFMDVVAAAMALIRKEPLGNGGNGGHDHDHDNDHGHTH